MDFTLTKYSQLLIAFLNAGYRFQTFAEFLKQPGKRVVILRHDIDKKPNNALKIANIESELGIQSTYFFLTKTVFKPDIIKQIADSGHEIGYHYRDLVDSRGDKEKAIVSFKKNIGLIRSIVPVQTIAMDGCPWSKYDNRDLWKKYNYKDFGIIGEPYFDVDFSKVFYLTDTGRCWDGDKYSVRDKVQSSFTQKFHTTDQIIKALKENGLSDQIMITTHPQRWTDNKIEWGIELVFQKIKNIIKSFLVE